MKIRLTNPRWPTSIQYQAKTIRSYSKRRVVLLNGAIARDHIAHFSGVLCELGEQPCKGQMLPCEEIKIMQESSSYRARATQGQWARAKHCLNQEYDAGYGQTRRHDMMLIDHIKTGSSIRKDSDG